VHRDGPRRVAVRAVTDERETGESDHTPEAEVEALARELADTINAGQVQGRERLREVALGLLRDEVRLTEPLPATVPAGSTTNSFNAFGIGIPLFLMGSVLVFLFPPVGLLMFAAAAVMIAWGVGTTLLRRS
jgi:hypothetical protein